MNKSLNRILVIVGMHRSMTSLVTQWLHKCGLNVGDDLYGAGIGNVKGHFEDRDFITLHDHVLKINNSHWRDHSENNYHIDNYSYRKSESMVSLKNSLYPQWGWKDPRTCLFLDHWEKVLPDAKFIIVYRPYAEIVDSFLRREFKVKNKIEYLLELKKYTSKLLKRKKRKEDNLKLWIKYNSSILDFLDKIPKERVIVIESDQLLPRCKAIFRTLTEEWGFQLDEVALGSIFDADITEQSTDNALGNVNPVLLDKARSIYQELKSYSRRE